ncbi:MAG: SHOCT domain-containing protein [Candidatus Dormibacteraeota bacterium]|nr:SHOCT domain-containing protein [Candidatus Dormibacteraeota bacterium]
MADTEREARRRAAFARQQGTSPLPISMTDLELPNGARLDDDEFVVRTSKDWGLSIKPLILTTRRLFCPSDLTGRSSVVLRLSDVRGVTLRKHWIGFSTIVVENVDRRQASFASHINGPLVRSDIAAMVDATHGVAAPNPTTAASSPAAGDRYQQLRELSELKQSGVLSEAEFEKEKARILKQP